MNEYKAHYQGALMSENMIITSNSEHIAGNIMENKGFKVIKVDLHRSHQTYSNYNVRNNR